MQSLWLREDWIQSHNCFPQDAFFFIYVVCSADTDTENAVKCRYDVNLTFPLCFLLVWCEMWRNGHRIILCNHTHTYSHTQAHIKNCCHQNYTYTQKHYYLRRNVYFQKLSLPLSPALLQRSLPHPSRATWCHATMVRLKVKRQSLLFLKKSETPASAVFLKCNLCLSFHRVLVYIGE